MAQGLESCSEGGIEDPVADTDNDTADQLRANTHDEDRYSPDPALHGFG